MVITSIGCDVDFGPLVFMINHGETVGAKDQSFYTLEGSLVISCPCQELLITFLVVRGVSMLVCSARAGRNVAIYLVRPSDPLTLVAVFGCGHVAMWLVLWGSGFVPAPEIICPRKTNSVAKRFDLVWLQ